jgi:hypothetical protein
LEKFRFIIAAVFLTLISCSKKNLPSDLSLFGLDYYPTQAGKFVIYDVDSIGYNDLPVDTVHYVYRLKEKIADTYTDNEGKPAIRLERFIKKYSSIKPYDSIPWTLKEVWMVNANQQSIQVVEGNMRFTKLIFPVEENVVWNGNANNTVGDWQYRIDYVDRSETINNKKLEKVLLVKQKDFRTLISYQFYSEKYARGVGLVQRDIINISSNKIVANVPVEKRIEIGFIVKQTLVNYGYE